MLLDQTLDFLFRCFENQVNKLLWVSLIWKQDRSEASKQTDSIFHLQAARAPLGGLGHFFTTFLTLNHILHREGNTRVLLRIFVRYLSTVLGRGLTSLVQAALSLTRSSSSENF